MAVAESNLARPSRKENMFTSRTAVIFVLSMLCTASALAQNTSTRQDTNFPEATHLRHSQHRNSSLLDRSDMQSPKPIPAVKPLRFQEIPVAADSSGAQVPNTPLPDQQAYPAPNVTIPQTQGPILIPDAR